MWRKENNYREVIHMSINIYSKIVERCTKENINIDLSFVGKVQELLKRGTSLDWILNNLNCLV